MAEDNLFAKIDSMKESIDVLEKKLNALAVQNSNSKSQQSPGIEKQRFNLTNFLLKSKKYFRWFGSKKEFNVKKTLAIVSYLLLVLFGCLATIFTTISYGGYTGTSIFGNIWLVLALIILLKTAKTSIEIRDLDLEKASTNKFGVSKYNLHFDTGKKKYRFYIFYWLAVIGIILDIILVCTKQGATNIGLPIVFQILFLIMIFVSSFLKILLFSGYHFAIYEGNDNGKLLRFVQDPIINKLMTYKEFEDTHLRFM